MYAEIALGALTRLFACLAIAWANDYLGEYSCLRTMMILRREFSYYLLQASGFTLESLDSSVFSALHTVVYVGNRVVGQFLARQRQRAGEGDARRYNVRKCGARWLLQLL